MYVHLRATLFFLFCVLSFGIYKLYIIDFLNLCFRVVKNIPEINFCDCSAAHFFGENQQRLEGVYLGLDSWCHFWEHESVDLKSTAAFSASAK